MTYHIPGGCKQPDPAELERYWKKARAELSSAKPVSDYHARWIGLDHQSTEEVIELIRTGDKTGTFTLPWIIKRIDQPVPRVGGAIMLVDFGGKPRLLVRLTDITTVAFGDVTAEHTAIDGTPVRDLAIWKPLHTHYWNALLKPFQLEVSESMPVLIEKFELLHAN